MLQACCSSEDLHLSKPGKDYRLCFFERRNRLLAGHVRELAQEMIERLAVLDVVKQSLKWHSRSSENGFTSEDIRVLDDDAIGHLLPLLTVILNQLRRMRISECRLALQRQLLLEPVSQRQHTSFSTGRAADLQADREAALREAARN